jgi:pimeloyl-ACP methyl ester carboxylesterase
VIAAAAVLATFRWQAHVRETTSRVEAAPSRGRFVRAADVQIFVQELGPSGAPVALGVKQATLVGHSFGGGPTMEATLLAPPRVRGLVLADAAIGLDAEAGGGAGPALVLRARPLRNALVAATVTNPRLTRRLLTQFVADPGAVTDARVHLLRAPLIVQGATDGFGDWLLDFLTSREIALSVHADAYRTLALPTLVMWGDRDATTPLAQGQRLAHLIAGAELAVMPGIGHMPQIEDAAQFNRLLLAFLQKS